MDNSQRNLAAQEKVKMDIYEVTCISIASSCTEHVPYTIKCNVHSQCESNVAMIIFASTIPRDHLLLYKESGIPIEHDDSSFFQRHRSIGPWQRSAQPLCL